MSEITITRALAEKKLLKKKIEDKINKIEIVAVTIGNQVKSGFETNEKFIKKSEEDLQSLLDLINNYEILTSKIIDSNNKTKVKIGDEEMTVSEAIARKNSFSDKGVSSGLEYILNKLQRDYSRALNIFESFSSEYPEKLNQYKTQQEKAKVSSETLLALTNDFEKNNKPKLNISEKIKKQIDEIEEKVNKFKMEVDFVLSEINAQTYIEMD